MSDQPLPYGWIREFDPTHNHTYYVDTKANPPRSIWVHPYEDEQYLSEHPDIREKVGNHHSTVETDLRPPIDDQRRHSYGGEGSRPMEGASGSLSNPGLNNKGKKRGVFGKLKDKAIGTKEEREAEKRRAAELERRRQQQYQEQMAALQQQQQYAVGAYGAPAYASPAGNPYQYRQGRFGGRGMGGMGMPLLGGLAGGLLLGDLIGGGFGDGGDFGGGDFGGGF